MELNRQVLRTSCKESIKKVFTQFRQKFQKELLTHIASRKCKQLGNQHYRTEKQVDSLTQQ